MGINRTPTKPSSSNKRSHHENSPDTMNSDTKKSRTHDPVATITLDNSQVDFQALLRNEFAQQKKDIASMIETKFEKLEEKMEDYKILLLGKVEQLETENSDLKKIIREQNDAILKLQGQMNGNYLVFSGIPETPTENTKTEIDKIIRDKLSLNITCTSAKRLHSNVKDKPRPTKVYFVSQEDRQMVFSKKKNMPQGQFINPYHPSAVMSVIRRLQSRRLQLRDEGITAKINFRTFELTYDDQTLHWTELPQEEKMQVSESD